MKVSFDNYPAYPVSCRGLQMSIAETATKNNRRDVYNLSDRETGPQRTVFARKEARLALCH